ncbi:PSP1 domain-containing protein [Sunxiuqinia sp. A32]|uniref:PSP1 domain-containing protein n=1 Tax=Sunxiuqinia sp. A32 TaxID=3461496 RepID=UPI004046331E
MGCNGCSANLEEDRTQMLGTHDWLKDIPDTSHLSNIVEVRFKGTRKEFFKNKDGLPIKIGDQVVVACSPGHDVGVVSLTGKLAEKQFERKIRKPERYQWNIIYRKATLSDKRKLEEAQKREQPVMIRARQIATELELNMKIGDVEFRGDNSKAIFYYIADERVDFRELIKRYAREFRIKVEMKQIGARQEAGRVGGIGSCGRELCCSTWRTDFSSVTSDAAIQQGLSPNAEKMAGKCGKLKCCLMYELDTYLEAQEDFPNELLTLETEKGYAKHFKTEILSKKIWYTIEENFGNKPFVIGLEDVKKIIQQNKRGIKPSIAKYLVTPEAPENEMSVGSSDIPTIEKKNSQPKRRFKKKRPVKRNNQQRQSGN